MAGRQIDKLEQELADRTRELRDAVAELESFAYSVSHDLRAPLRAINGFAEALVEDFGEKLDPEARRLLGIIQQNSRRMGQMIDALLEFSRLGRKPLEIGPLDMAAIAQDIVDELRQQERGRAIDIAIAPLPETRGDRGLVRRVLVNLIGNALKFTRGRADARVEIGSRPESGQTVYYVRDNGVGFDMRYAQKLFGVFQRLHRADEFEGTGVGLAVAQRIIHRHGGRIWADGKVDEGATLYFTLPGGLMP